MSNFLDGLNAAITNDTSKIERYDHKISKLFALTKTGLTEKQFNSNHGYGNFTTVFVNEMIMPDNFAFDALRVSKAISLNALVTKKDALRRSEFFRHYRDVRKNYSSRAIFALVFDRHGDALSDLVLHNGAQYANEANWTLRIFEGDEYFYIQPLKGFMAAFAKEHNDLSH